MSLTVGVAVVALRRGVRRPSGLIAGYSGGRIDASMMRWVDTQVAFPGLLHGAAHPRGHRAEHEDGDHRARAQRLDGLRAG